MELAEAVGMALGEASTTSTHAVLCGLVVIGETGGGADGAVGKLVVTDGLGAAATTTTTTTRTVEGLEEIMIGGGDDGGKEEVVGVGEALGMALGEAITTSTHATLCGLVVTGETGGGADGAVGKLVVTGALGAATSTTTTTTTRTVEGVEDLTGGGGGGGKEEKLWNWEKL